MHLHAIDVRSGLEDVAAVSALSGGQTRAAAVEIQKRVAVAREDGTEEIGLAQVGLLIAIERRRTMTAAAAVIEEYRRKRTASSRSKQHCRQR